MYLNFVTFSMLFS